MGLIIGVIMGTALPQAYMGGLFVMCAIVLLGLIFIFGGLKGVLLLGLVVLLLSVFYFGFYWGAILILIIVIVTTVMMFFTWKAAKQKSVVY